MSSSFRLHSKYNPQKEADNFASTVQGSPLFIVITEPGESYLVSSFRKRFPHAKIFAIRYTTHLFLETDGLFDAVWRGAPQGITFFLVNNIPDEYFSRCIFLSWLPSENVWKDEARMVWKEIKKASKTFLSIINTRSFFGNTWVRNLFRNLIFSKRINKVNFKEVGLSSFFLTSGASLEEFIKDDEIKDMLNHSFTLAASSSFSSLIHHGVKPFFTMATDGGFWAEPHLKYLKDSLLLFPLEARIPYSVLENVPIAFISYASQLENYFFDALQIPYLSAKRNGTIAGTAIDFLLEHTKGTVCISGLDLSFSHNFTHSRPNENMETNLLSANKLNPATSILADSQFSQLSLSTYASWFSSMSVKKKERLRRIGKAGIEIEGVRRIDKKDVFSLQATTLIQDVASVKEVKMNEKKTEVFLSFFDKIEGALNEGEFFNELLKKHVKTVEKEVCELIAFSDYVALIKHTDMDNDLKDDVANDKAKNIGNIKQSIREKVLNFIKKERKIVNEITKLGD